MTFVCDVFSQLENINIQTLADFYTGNNILKNVSYSEKNKEKILQEIIKALIFHLIEKYEI